MATKTSPEMIRAIEDAYGVPRGLITKDPEAAALAALVAMFDGIEAVRKILKVAQDGPSS